MDDKEGLFERFLSSKSVIGNDNKESSPTPTPIAQQNQSLIDPKLVSFLKSFFGGRSRIHKRFILLSFKL